MMSQLDVEREFIYPAIKEIRSLKEERIEEKILGNDDPEYFRYIASELREWDAIKRTAEEIIKG